MAFGGASERLAFILSLDANGAISGFKKVGDAADRELGRADNRLDRIGGQMQVFGAGALATAGVVGTALVGMARQSEEANRSQLLLQNTLDNIPTLAGETVDAFNEQADAIQSVTAADGDAVVAAQAMLGTFRLTGDEIRGITPLVVDYARKFQVDLTDAAIQVGKALDGQSGALRRNGVSIDAALFATDRYAAVQQALSEQVGGFAEQEGATFAGSIERLKNQIGDLAEGVGTGAVDAFGDFIGVAQVGIGVVDGLGAGTQAGIGRFAAYAAAATGVVGALSLVSGTVLKSRDNLRGMADAMHLSERAVGRLATAGKTLAGVGMAFAIADIADAATGASESVSDMADELARMADTELLEQLSSWFKNNLATDVEVVDRLFRDLAETNQATAQRMRDAAEAAGYESEVLAAMDAVLADSAEGHRQAAVDAQANADALDEGADAAGRNTTATQRNTDAIRTNQQAFEDLIEARESSLQNDLDLQSAMIDSARELEDYNRVLRDNESTELDRQEAGIRLIETYLRQGEAARQNAEDEARAAGRASSAVQEGRDAQIASLMAVADTLAPGSYLRQQLDGYIWTLATGIPRDVTTRVHLDLSELNELQAQYPNVRIPIASTTDLNTVTGKSVNVTINASGVGADDLAQRIGREVTWGIN